MIIKKAKISIEYLYISVFINLALLLIILFLIRRTKQAVASATPTTPKQLKSKVNSSITSYSQQPTSKHWNSTIAESHLKQTCSDVENSHIQLKSAQANKATQTDFRETPQQLISILQEELQLQRNRNQLLQRRQENQSNPTAKQDLPTAVHQSEDVDLTNQLQFCQARLKQSMESQTKLKREMEQYRRINISILNHPQYQRLRQLNNRYKDTINKLQNCLLNRHKDHFIDLSFRM